MVAVPRPSPRARQTLPVLSKIIEGLAYAAARRPAQAARTMVLAVQHDWRRNQDPYGQPWKPVRISGGKTGGLVRRFDPVRHVRDSWYPVVVGIDAVVASDHVAAAALQPKNLIKRRTRRLMHPVEGRGIGTWAKRIEKMDRDLVYGAVMGTERREQVKLAAEGRRAAQHEARNLARVRMGKKPLALRKKRRSDRARIDALVVRAIG